MDAPLRELGNRLIRRMRNSIARCDGETNLCLLVQCFDSASTCMPVSILA